MDFLSHLFDTTGFPPRWYCGAWSSGHGWLHILSDLGVWSAYLAIPCVLMYYLIRRRDLPFRGIFVLFGMFILACGTTHLMEAIIFWWPAYRLAGVIKLLTAIVSWGTVLALIPTTPKVLAMRSPEELAREIAARQAAEAALRRANAELESRVRDRTAELEKSNAELFYQREWFRTTLASIGDAVITTDTAGFVTSLNTVAERLTGWKNAEAHLKPLAEIFAISDDSTGEPMESPIVRCLRDGSVVGLANHALITARDGRRTPIDDSAAPIRNADGAITGSVLVFRDVSEQRAAKESIVQAVAELRALVEMSPVAIFRASDASGKHITGNPAANALFRSQAAGNLSVTAPPGPDISTRYTLWQNGRKLEPHEAPMQYALRTGKSVRDVELDIEFPDGEVRHLVSHAMPLFDGHGNVRGGYSMATDVTSLKRLERDLRAHAEQLQEADRRKDEFLATLAHELRNPLAPVRNALHILRTTDGTGDIARAARETMERQLHHMVRLVDDLLDVSRISRGRLELRKSRIALADVFRIALETSQPLIESLGHRLHVELPKEPIWLDADQVRLSQVVANLVNNAAKYSEHSSDIWVSAAADNGEVVVRVRDSGLGIPGDMLGRVFDLFTQVDRTLDRTQGGLGIGLKLVKQLVELHGGSVEALSDGVGRGSEFIVRLPHAAGPNHTEATLSRGGNAANANAKMQKRRILVVDDNRDAADSLADILGMTGHEVMVAYDGPSALVAADQNPPEIAILDLGLPAMSGHELGKLIRARPWGKDVFLIALTGWGQEADKRRTQQIGFDSHLVKPVEVPMLLQLLQSEREAVASE